MATTSVDNDDDRRHDQERHLRCFREWTALQQDDLAELLDSLALDNDNHPQSLHERLIEKNIRHFREYMENRLRLAKDDVSAFFAPAWCASLENSMMWIAGCRPSLFIRLVYVLCGSEVNENLSAFLEGGEGIGVLGNLADLSSRQLSGINQLQANTIKEEEKLSNKLASLQEEMADHPIATIARRTTQIADSNGEVEHALDKHEKLMLRIMEVADKLRMDTLKEMIEILTPAQAVEFIAAGKKLHLCVHEWAKRRDHRHGRNSGE
ncbi:hypothetical protein MLD38_039932 [Melastoma candidum]|uniref:Uncharacterized protein n=1 Tax=Melastoma candidum TaxID=119954 RepID=A0ACB9L4U3_9MYRT|nr:hypothetical protein MLD38_039932 [Melastoma candidum]